MRRGAEFALTVRTGTRAGRPLLVGHLLVRPDALQQREPARVGFVSSCAGIFSRCLAVAFLWCAQMPRPRTQASRISPQIWIR
jgi:hypothetical protein